jgi:hypothetical protein
MSKRPLGPWVWCRYCRNSCAYGFTTAREMCPELIATGRWYCHPRLTFWGWVRYTLGLTIGENDE